MSTTLKLVYFNVKGLAETSRILLKLAQQPFEDYRFPLGPEFEHVEFDQAKAEGHLDSSMGKLPFLEVNTKKGKVIIPQSKSIERYLAKTYGFMGANDLEAARIDAVCECIRDIRDRYQKEKKETPDLEEYWNITLKQEFENLIKVLEPSVSQFAVGNKLSLADVTIYTLVTQVYGKDSPGLNIAGRIERIREIVMAVGSRPEVAMWVQRRPATKF